jgi:hypothetical protein
MRAKAVAMRHIFAILALAACGSPTNTTPDAARHIDAAPPDVAIDAPTPRQGFVTIAQGTDNMGTTSSASASITSDSPFGTMTGSNGPCIEYTPTTNQSRYSAGVIDITGANVAITLTPSGTAPMVRYTGSPAPLPKPLFATNASIAFHAAGGPDLVSFSATVSGPAPITGFTPPTMLSRAGYTATWTAGSGPGVWIIVAGITGSSGATLLCKVPDTGSYAIPAASFALLPSSATMGLILVARVAETSATTVQGPILIAVAATYASGVIPLNP